MRGTFRQFEIFLTVANTGSFSAAANVLDISQASVSKQVAALERALGQPLFRRQTGQAVTLTPRGEELRAKLPDLMAHAASVAATVAPTTVRVGADAMILERYFYPALAEFTLRFPGTVLEFAEIASEAEALDRMGSVSDDLVFFTFRERLDAAYGPPLKTGKASIFGARHHVGMLRQHRVTTQRLPVILPLEGTSDDAIHIATLADLGVPDYDVVARAQRMTSRLDMAAAGIGLCVAPVHFVHAHANNQRLDALVDGFTLSHRYRLTVSQRNDAHMDCARDYLTGLLT